MKKLRSILKGNPVLFPLALKIWRFFKYVFIGLRLKGARGVGVDQFENGILILNRKTSLGLRGEKITTPHDQTIYRHVVENGEWEPEESRFLSSQLISLTALRDAKHKIALVDIGANSGLVTRQTLTLSQSHCDAVLVEPIPNHARAIEANLEKFKGINRVEIIEAALGEKSGDNEIRIEISNKGNSSFLASAMPNSGVERLSVKILSVEKFYNGFLSNFDYFVLKSDTQGFDSKILALLPTIFWSKCQGAVIEVWALSEIEVTSVKILLSKWVNFPYLNWATDGSAPTNLEEISKFWLSKTGNSRNLFISANTEALN